MTGRHLLAALAAAALGSSALGAGESVTVVVTRFRNTKGVLECTLFTERGFPTHPELAAAQRHAPIRPDRTGVCRFEEVLPGEYAVGVMHDENANGKMDFDFFHMPAEGYGISNNHTHAFSAPKWRESRFAVGPGQQVRLDVKLRY